MTTCAPNQHPHTYPLGSVVYVIADENGHELPPYRLGTVVAFGWANLARTIPAYRVEGQTVGSYAEFSLGTIRDAQDIG